MVILSTIPEGVKDIDKYITCEYENQKAYRKLLKKRLYINKRLDLLTIEFNVAFDGKLQTAKVS